MKLNFLTLGLFTLLLSSTLMPRAIAADLDSDTLAEAPAEITPSAGVKSTYLNVKSKDALLRFRLASRMNDAGLIEVNVYFLQDRGLYDSEKIVFYGRDLDGDGYPETWFIRQDIFIPQIIRHDRTDPSHASDLGQDAITHLISRMDTLKKDNYFKELFFKVGEIGTSTVANMLAAKDEFVLNEVDLHSLQVQINRRKELLPPGTPVPIELQKLQAIVIQGFDQNLAHFEKAFESDYWKSAYIETAINVTIVKVGQLVTRGGVWIARSIGSMERAAVIADSFEAFSKRLKLKIGMGEKAETLVSDTVIRSAFGLSYRAIMADTRAALRALAARNVIADKAFTALSAIGRTYYRGAFTQFKYLAQTQFLQILAEAYDKRADIYDPNPIIMTKNLFKNRDFIQDFAFMTHESMLQAGIASGPGSFGRRFAIAGVISLVDSGVMNVAIKGVADPKRVGLDTGWEMIIGNLQTQLDVASLKYFEELAIKQNNKKLKLVGYAIALVDQFVGYTAYSNVSSRVSKPAANPSPTRQQLAHNAQALAGQPGIKLIPILAEVN